MTRIFDVLDLTNAYMEEIGDSPVFESLDELVKACDYSQDDLTYFTQNSDCYQSDSDLYYTDYMGFIHSMTWEGLHDLEGEIPEDFKDEWIEKNR